MFDFGGAVIAIVATKIHLMPNWTIAVQLGIFLSALVVLNFLVFRPIMHIFDTRRKYTSDAEDNEMALSGESERLERSRTGALSDALAEAQLARAKAISRAQSEGEQIIADAREDARLLALETEVSIESSERSIFEEMNEEANEISEEIVREIVPS